MILLCITALTLITIDLRGGTTGPLGSVRSGVREVFSPVQKGFSAVATPVGDFFSGITNASELKRENRQLREEVTELETRNKTFEAAANENERLKKLLEITESVGTTNTPARVITGSPSNFETTIQIDRGTNSGIIVGDVVVSGDGLVGRIIETSRTRSTILLITDSSSGVGVRNTRSEVIGIAQGVAGRNTLDMEFVDPDADIRKGDNIVTSGLEFGRFPPDIPVATVTRVRNDPSGLTKFVTITPIVELQRLSIVSVLHTAERS